ncbi:ribosomal protein S18-alanine N-acetyltransferase [Marinobacterium marinum]|uniref:[Ribosomal protein bS18]-alanine N-acetyltransferase n=1 Tax=Marinobacterium marinum TaxID=2756129 RepID=A0A7W1WZ15_9GAMM|nr:ribosomal protein S18-alanine N-acetyltransferase [Marinobacterium marinum]MBA4502832.1 ribosomal protein S18-alanine N-acetyltransferase [Marinobacterium marinum]
MTDICSLNTAALSSVQTLDESCFADEPFASAWWHKAVDERGAAAWLCWRGEQLAGYCLFSRVLDEAELLRVATAPAARRQGVGIALLQHAEQALRADGIERLLLEVRQSNRSAQALYQKLGWQTIARRKDYYPHPDGYEDALIYQRTL